MSYSPPPGPSEPKDPNDPNRRNRPSNGRIAVWIGVSAVALYFLGSGIYGIITGGS
ncbi:hypothetical protein [Herbiconiux solani]|uniref:hypothetical protein n=1 Tax=Herbiconiux solani TaxID=661329 RepID=UPI0012EDE958|nr:hypothetical protein [Herbiconiux solani]